MTDSLYNKVLFGLCVLCFALFVTQSLFYKFNLTSDSYNYINIAQNINDGQGIVQSNPAYNDPHWNWNPSSPDTIPPTQSIFYPILIAAVAAIFPVDDYGHAALLISAFAGLLVLLLSGVAANLYFGKGAAALTVALLIAALPVRYVAERAWTDSIGLLFIVAFLISARFMSSSSKHCSVAGLWAFMGIFTRQAMLSLVLFGLACAACIPQKWRISFNFKHAFIYALYCGIPTALFYTWSIMVDRPFFITFPNNPFDIQYILNSSWNFWLEIDSRFLPVLAIALLFVWRMGFAQIKDFLFGGKRYILVGWAVCYSLFLIAALSNSLSPPVERRFLAPVEWALIMLGSGMLLRIFPPFAGRAGKHALAVALIFITLSSVINMAFLKEHTTRDMEIENSDTLRWVAEFVTPADLIISHYQREIPFYFEGINILTWWKGVHPTPSFSQMRQYIEVRCARHDNFYLLVQGKNHAGHVTGVPDDVEKIAELKNSTVYQMNYCPGKLSKI